VSRPLDRSSSTRPTAGLQEQTERAKEASSSSACA
jgi:hypothetical protein